MIFDRVLDKGRHYRTFLNKHYLEPYILRIDFLRCIIYVWLKYIGGIEMLARYPAIIGIMYMFYALPLTPPNRFNEAWTLFDDEIESVSYNNEILRAYLVMLLDYVRQTWFQSYSPDDWNHYSNSRYEWLTNNVSESGNARLKKKHPSPNPGFYKLVVVIQHEISNSLKKLDQVFAGLLTLRHSKRHL